MREPQCFLLGMQLRNLKAIDQDLETLDARIGAQLEPYQAQHRLLMQIPGVDWVTAASIIAEIGVDMDVFANARRLAAWAELAKVPLAKPVECQRRAGSPRATTRVRANRKAQAHAGATCS